MKKKILSHDKKYIDLNIFMPTEEKSPKKIIFKTIQSEKDIKLNSYNGKIKKRNFAQLLQKIKTKSKDNQSSKILFLNHNINNTLNTSRNNNSYKDFLQKKFSVKDYNTIGSKIFVRNMIKINKPHLLKILNKDLINNENKTLESPIIKPYHSFKFNNYNKTEEDIFEKSTSSRIYKAKNKDIFSQEFTFDKDLGRNKKKEIKNNFLKTYKKFPKININFPLNLPNWVNSDKLEIEDKVNMEYFKDEKLKKKLKKALYFEINSFGYDNRKYNEYKNSMQNYINYIYDINIIPHIKNKFLYRKPVYENRKKDNILFSKNVINKEDAKAINRWLIHNMKKDIMKEEKRIKKEQKMEESSVSNKYIKKLYLDYNDEEFPKLTTDDVAELDDFFGKNINYKAVKFASNKLKNVVYKESLAISKKNNEKNNYIRTNKFMINT